MTANKRIGIALILLAALSVVSCETAGKLAFWRKDQKQKAPQPAFAPVAQHALPETRTVEMTCELTVDDVAKDIKEVRVWMPFPASGSYQRVTDPQFSHPTSYRPLVNYDERYGSRLLYVSAEAPLPTQFKMTWTAQIERSGVDHHAATAGEPMSEDAIRKKFAPDLEQTHLAPLEGKDLKPEDIAAQRTAQATAFEKRVAEALSMTSQGDANVPEDVGDDVAAALDAAEAAVRRRNALSGGGTFARARAVYDYVLYKLSPDNVATAGPQRTVTEILDAGTGDAADYALVTVAMLRALGIPARVESGVLLGEDVSADPSSAGSRSAWVRFCVNGRGWSACDPYLGDRTPALREYMFRGLCANRVRLADGPEPRLTPKPEAGYPVVFDDVIAEADGKPVHATLRFSFRDVAGGR